MATLGKSLGAWLVAAAVLLAVPTAARAAKPRIAVIGLGMGDVTAEVRVKMNAAIVGGLAASGADVVDSATTGKAMAERGMVACDTATCLAEIGRASGAAYLMRGSMEMVGRSYIIHLEMVDAATASVIDSREDRCEICTENEAYETASVSASALKAQVFKWRTPVSAPPPAPASSSPVGGDGTALVGLSASPDLPGASPPVRARSPALVWTTGAVAVAAIAAGVTLLGIDGRSGCSAAAGMTCAPHDTKVAGLTVSGLGLAAAVASVLMFTGRF